MASKADKTKGESGRIVQFAGERILALAEYCFIAQAARPDQFVTPNGVRLHRRRQYSWTLGALKRFKYFAQVQLRDRTEAALSFAGSNQSPNESLKLDPGRDLRSVGRNFIGITAAIVIVIKIAEAKFGIEAPGNLAA